MWEASKMRVIVCVIVGLLIIALATVEGYSAAASEIVIQVR